MKVAPLVHLILLYLILTDAQWKLKHFALFTDVYFEVTHCDAACSTSLEKLRIKTVIRAKFGASDG